MVDPLLGTVVGEGWIDEASTMVGHVLGTGGVVKIGSRGLPEWKGWFFAKAVKRGKEYAVGYGNSETAACEQLCTEMHRIEGERHG